MKLLFAPVFSSSGRVDHRVYRKTTYITFRRIAFRLDEIMCYRVECDVREI